MAPPTHLLLVSPTTGYQAEQFRRAAEKLAIKLTLATNRCDQLDNPWGDQAVAVKFENPKAALPELRQRGPFQGVVACGDRGALLAAQLASPLGLAFHPVRAAQASHDKYTFRQILADAGLPSPWFRRERLDADPAALAAQVDYPCVLKPLMLSASRGVIRADNPEQFTAAFTRIRQLLESPEIQQQQDPNARYLQIEGFLPGVECALEGWMSAGVLQRFALFDKPDPLNGPYFEESLYVAPSRLDTDCRAVIWDMVEAAARAICLGPGPVHAEVRWSDGVCYVLEIAARSIGGLCGRALRFRKSGKGELISLEELLIRGALGEPLNAWEREPQASGVMMIPIPRSGVFDRIEGVEAAQALPGIESVEITAKPDQPLRALPEGATYLGFIFAHAATPEAVEAALRAAHAQLRITLREALPVL